LTDYPGATPLEPIPEVIGYGPVVDAHHHLWDLHRAGYAWLREPGDPATTAWIGDYKPIRRSYLIDEYAREAGRCGIVKSVHVEANRGAQGSVDETRWLQAIAQRRGFPHAIVASADLSASDIEARLDEHVASPNVRGIRNVRMGGFGEPAFRRGFAALAERGLAFDANLLIEEAGEALDLAATFRATTIAINNLANPPALDGEALARWTEAMLPLADAPNIVMKISGVGMADHKWTVEAIKPWVLCAVDVFSPDRCMFGSNWPVDSLYGSLTSLVSAVGSIVGELGPRASDAILRGTAERCYRI
jgi:predicted TIM-barrel fold metal-dependent hydrolase